MQIDPSIAGKVMLVMVAVGVLAPALEEARTFARDRSGGLWLTGLAIGLWALVLYAVRPLLLTLAIAGAVVLLTVGLVAVLTRLLRPGGRA